MVDNVDISSKLDTFHSLIQNYKSILDSLQTSWNGISYENLVNKSVSFLEEYANVVSSHVTSYAQALTLYQDYLNYKNNLTIATNNYNTAVLNKNTIDANRFNNDITTIQNSLKQLADNINACLASINVRLESPSVQASIVGGDTKTTLLEDGTIGYIKTRYSSDTNSGVTVWYAVIPKDMMPKLGIANDDYTKVSKEAPTSMAKRKNAALAINFGIENTKQGGILYADGKLVRGNNITSGDTLYLAQDGLLKSVPNSQYSTEDILALNPVWASKGFYTIVQDGQFVSTWDPAKNSKEVVSRREPRTFIGQDYDGNYIVGVCHGRRKGEAGMNMIEIYDFVSKNINSNIRILYNADGGGSSAFVYQGEKVNPNIDTLDSGATVERLRPDIIYWS
ncbi:MAG: phosphodiester glycosidase family protein [Bacilli bacterium]|nr:phosphodiester glycosidase family protein [Bacilli bacterium]